MQESAAESGTPIPQQAIDAIQSPIARVISFFGVAVSQAAFILISAVLYFFLASVIFGGTAKFKQVWVVSCWAYVIAMLGQIVKTPLILAKNNIEAGLGFGLLFTEEMVGPKLHKFFGVIDIFGIWHFIVAGIGLAVLYKFTTKKGIGIAFIIWLLLTAIGGITAYLS
jgi:hypothetical protein